MKRKKHLTVKFAVRLAGLIVSAVLLFCGCTSIPQANETRATISTGSCEQSSTLSVGHSIQQATEITFSRTATTGENKSSAAAATARTTAAKKTTAPEPKSSSLPFWEVKKSGGTGRFYILGTLPFGSADMYPLPDVVEKAYTSCKYFAIAYDAIYRPPLELNLEEYLAPLYLGAPIAKKVMGDYTYKIAKGLLDKYALYSPLMEYYMPAYWDLAIAAGIRNSYSDIAPVDSYFLSRAEREGKPCLELEEPMHPYETLAEADSFAPTKIINYDADVLFAEMDRLTVAWKNGTITYEDAVGQLLLHEQFYSYLYRTVTYRNIWILESIENYIEKGKSVFCVVDLTHMLGEDGIVNALKRAGYQVTAR